MRSNNIIDLMLNQVMIDLVCSVFRVNTVLYRAGRLLLLMFRKDDEENSIVILL